MTDFRMPPLSMVMLGVRDLDKSVSFYRDRLGIQVRQQFPGFAFLDTGSVSVILSEALAKNSPTVAGATEVIFNVEDVRASAEELEKKGIEFVRAPHQVNGPMWAANFRDPDGHLLTVFGPERKAT